MQKIILCPTCRVQVKKDNLGELLCHSCGVRLCPKAHVFDGKICQFCGWEDPNYSLWQKAQKARQQSSVSRKPKESSFNSKPQYMCPRCYTQVNTSRGICPDQRGCGYSGLMQRRDVPEPAASAPPALVSKPTGITSRSYESVPPASSKTSIAPHRSPFLKEVSKTERTPWEFPSLRRFVRPILASLLLCIIIIGLIFGGIYATRFFSRITELWAQIPDPFITSSQSGVQIPDPTITPSKTYTLSMSVVPEASGEIKIVSPTSSTGTFAPGSQITLLAVPDDCHAFNYWVGVDGSAETITISMDSNKSITANFRAIETSPPVIAELKAACNSDISATITWLTDKPATSQVEYGNTKDYGLTAISNGELTTNHKVRMTGLVPNTTYYFSVKSADKCGTEANETKMLTTLREIKSGERVGERAIDFTLPYYNDDSPESPNKAGNNETLSTYIGKKKILLNFWSTFCGACIGEFPYIRGIYENENLANRNSANSDFVVFTICIDTKIDEAPGRIKTLEGKFSDESGPFTFPILFDTVGQTKKDYHIWTIPETVFIDTDGIIREIKIGRFKNIEEIEAILESLN